MTLISPTNFVSAIDMITAEEFKKIKDFILDKGDRRSYCNRFNNNPHYRMPQCDIYLNPSDVMNTACDSTISDFNEIVFYNPLAENQYYYVRIENKGNNDLLAADNEVTVNIKDDMLVNYLKEVSVRISDN